MIANCPQCTKLVRLPSGGQPDWQVKCPVCEREYTLAEIFAALPPELIVVKGSSPAALPEMAAASAGAPGAGLAGVASSSVGDDDDFVAAIIDDEPHAAMHAGGEVDSFELAGDGASTDDEMDFDFSEGVGTSMSGSNGAAATATVAPIKARTAKKKKPKNPLVQLIGIVLGGFVGIFFGYVILLWVFGNDLGLAKHVPSWALYAFPTKIREQYMPSPTPATNSGNTANNGATDNSSNATDDIGNPPGDDPNKGKTDDAAANPDMPADEGKAKTDDAKADEAKPDETKPGETKPGETKPGETKPDEVKPEDKKPSDDPFETPPPKGDPAKSEKPKPKPVDTDDPLDIKPADLDPLTPDAPKIDDPFKKPKSKEPVKPADKAKPDATDPTIDAKPDPPVEEPTEKPKPKPDDEPKVDETPKPGDEPKAKPDDKPKAKPDDEPKAKPDDEPAVDLVPDKQPEPAKKPEPDKKTEKPAAAETAQWVVDQPAKTDAVIAAVTAAKEATAKLTPSENKTAFTSDKFAAYTKLCDAILAQHRAVGGEHGDELDKQIETLTDMVLTVVTDIDHAQVIGQLANARLARGGKSNGLLVVGLVVKTEEKKGAAVRLTTIELPAIGAKLAARKVIVVTPIGDMGVVKGINAVAHGVIVEKPATSIKGYAGPDERVIWAENVMPQVRLGTEDKPADEKATDEKATDEKPADVKPADEKPADEKPADEKPADEKPADEKPADEKPADEKGVEKKADEKADESESTEKKADEAAKETREPSVEEPREIDLTDPVKPMAQEFLK